MNVKDKVIVITGGASGIGLSCSEKLLLRDAKFVAIFDVPSPSVEATVNKLKKQFGDNRTGLYACDVTKNEQVESSFGKVIDLFGSFDVLINSAGIFSQVNWQHMIDVNFTGLVRTTLKAIDLIGKHKGGKGGTILNVASTLGFKPWEYMPIYSGTKSGVIGITLGLKHFYPITGVRMLLVCPGFTDTSFSPKLFSATYFDFIDAEKLKENTKGKICQPVRCVSDTILGILEKGENGDTSTISRAEPPMLVEVQDFDELPSRPFYK